MESWKKRLRRSASHERVMDNGKGKRRRKGTQSSANITTDVHDVESDDSNLSLAWSSGTDPPDPQDIKCGVCFEDYKDPQLLPCLHSFCKDCLKENLSNKIICPFCRGEHDSNTLLPNSMLSDVVKASCTDTIPLTCGQCISSPAEVVIFCRTCDDYLCHQCKVAHEKMVAFKDHMSSLVSVDDAKLLPKLKKEYKCLQHAKFLSVYCEMCKIVICSDCALYGHRGHDIKPAEEAVSEVKANLTAYVASARGQLQVFQEHCQTIQQSEKHVTTYPDELKAFITKEFDKLLEEIESRKQTLLERVDSTYDGFSKMLWAEKNTIDVTISRIEAGIKMAEGVCNSENDLELAVLGAQTCKSLKEVNNVCWDPQVVKGLGPLVYLRKEHFQATQQTESQFIGNIGHLFDVKSHDKLELNLQLNPQTINPAPASQFSHSFYYQHLTLEIQAGTVIVNVTNNKLLQVDDILFPYKLNSSVICRPALNAYSLEINKNEEEVISHTFSGGKITFNTCGFGEYVVTVGIGTEIIKSITLHFRNKQYGLVARGRRRY
jgi:hypothetical protein